MTDNKYAKPANRRRHIPRAAAILATLGIVLGSGGVAYAMDLGGIQEIVHVWIHGEETDATFNYENGEYNIEVEKEDGTTEVVQSGGGVAYENGKERPLTADELLEEINSPEVIYNDDGSVWLYYMDQEIDLTDKFEDDVCYMELEMEGETKYVTIKYQNGFAISPDGYIPAEDFN